MTIKEINPHAMSIDEVAESLNTLLSTGLSEKEAEKRLDEYGLNELV